MDTLRVLKYALAHLAFSLIFSLHSIKGTVKDLSFEANLESNHGKFKYSMKSNAMNIIKTKYGDQYECVELYKQPALAHNLLKNHKIQMRPRFLDPIKEAATIAVGSGSSAENSIDVGFTDSCPLGTVPIRRRNLTESLRAKAIFRQQFQSSHTSNSPLIFAGISTMEKEGTIYHGAGGYVSINNPTVSNGQMSCSAISIEGGGANDFSVIRVGWMVNLLYHGDETRLYTAWGQIKNGKMHGCLNTECAGFVQTDPETGLDMILKPYSVIRGPQYYVKLAVNRDKSTGNWWLLYGEYDKPIGYWPSKLFLNLKDGATTLRWGGLVNSATPQMPIMGNGDNGELHSSHFRQIAIKYQAETTLNGTIDVPIGVTKNKCYKAGDNSYKTEFWGYSFYFGGNGGDVSQLFIMITPRFQSDLYDSNN